MNGKRIILVDEQAAMGGVEHSTLLLAVNLDRRVFDPLVVCPEEGDLPRLCRERGVDVRVVPCGKLFSISARLGSRYAPNPLAILANVITLFNGALRLAALLRRERADVICTKGLTAHFQGGLAARLARVPCVWHVQDCISGRAFGLYRRLIGLSAWLLADRVIADGPTIVEQMPANLRSAGKVDLVYNGVDTEEFQPSVDGQRVRQEFGLSNDCLLVGNVARLVPWKGQKHLLEAAARLAPEFPNVHFVIVGSPLFGAEDYERELRAMAATPELAGRVTFTGYRTDVSQVLGAIDIFAYTAVEKDTSPLALLSAMAVGKPIVAPDLSGVSELFVAGVDGILVPPATTDRLVEALRKLLTSAEMRASLGRNAREKAVRELSVQQFARRCEEVFALALAPEKREPLSTPQRM